VAEIRRGVLLPLLGALAVLCSGLLAGCGSGDGRVATVRDLNDDHGYHGAWLDRPFTVPDVALTDTAGERYTLAEDPADLTLVFFGYTNCPDVCQVVMSTIASAVTRLDPAERRQVRVAFVTTDPTRDTRQALRGYLDRFDPQFVGLTGPLARIDALGRPLGVYIKKGQRLPSGGYEVDHTASVTAVRDGRAPLVWTQGASPTDMAADIHRLLEES
jgi:protein SCO1/2